MRVLIAGVPQAGKTTLAAQFDAICGDVPIRQTDSLIGLMEWSETSEEVSRWLDESAFLIEGVAVPRALRKWLARNESGKPCDVVIWIDAPCVALTDGQARMAKGCRTVFDSIRPELERRGVSIWRHHWRERS